MPSSSKRKASTAAAATSSDPSSSSYSSSTTSSTPSRVFSSLRKSASGFFSSLTPRGKRKAQRVANELVVTEPLITTPSPAKKRARIDAPDSLGREESRRLFALLHDEEQPGYDSDMVGRLESDAVATIVRPRVLDPAEEMRDDEEIEDVLGGEPSQPQAVSSRLPDAGSPSDSKQQQKEASSEAQAGELRPPSSPRAASPTPTRRSPRSKGKQKADDETAVKDDEGQPAIHEPLQANQSEGELHINGSQPSAFDPEAQAEEAPHDAMDIEERADETINGAPAATSTNEEEQLAPISAADDVDEVGRIEEDPIAPRPINGETSTVRDTDDVNPAIEEATASVNGQLESNASAEEEPAQASIDQTLVGLYPALPPLPSAEDALAMDVSQPSGDALTEDVLPVEAEVLAGEAEGLKSSADDHDEMAAPPVEEPGVGSQKAQAREEGQRREPMEEQGGQLLSQPAIAVTSIETGEPEDVIMPVNGETGGDGEAQNEGDAVFTPSLEQEALIAAAATSGTRPIEVIDFTGDDSFDSSDDEEILIADVRKSKSPAPDVYQQRPSSGFLRGPLAAQNTPGFRSFSSAASQRGLGSDAISQGEGSGDATQVIRQMGRISLDRRYTPSIASARSQSELRGDVFFGGSSIGGSRIRPKRAHIGERDHKRHLQQARRSNVGLTAGSPSSSSSARPLHPHLHAFRNHDTNIDDATSLARYRQHLATALGPSTPAIHPRPAAVGGLKPRQPRDSARLRNLELLLQKSRYAKSRISVPPSKELLRLRREEKERERRRRGILGRPPLPSALEAEQEAAVQRILSDGSWKISIPGATATNRDVSMLRPRQWMNDETITFYMTMINERSKKAAAERAAAKTPADRKKWGAFYRVHCFNSYFWAKLDTEGYQSVSRWTRRIDVFAQDLILIPCNLGNSHWTCAAINFRRKRVEYYDSMGGRNGRVVAALKDYLRRELKDKKKEGTVDVVPEEFGEYYGGEKSPQQRNGYDCGVFVCSTLEQLSRRDPHYPFDEDPEEEDEDEDSWEDDEGDDLGLNGHGNGGKAPSFSSGYQWNFSQDDMPYMRRRIIYEISQKGLLD